MRVKSRDGDGAGGWGAVSWRCCCGDGGSVWLWRCGCERGAGKDRGRRIEVGESWLDGRGGVVVIVGVSCGGNL